jgi:hypothetical protein
MTTAVFRQETVTSPWQVLLSPYSSLAACLLLTAPFYFLRGIGIFDDSLFLKFGEMIRDGALPYRDFYENKPPGVYYVAALIAWLGRGHWLAPRVFLFGFAALFGAAVTAFAQRRYGVEGGRRAAWLFGMSYALAQGYSLHTEQFCGFCGFLAALAVAGDRKQRASAWFAAGILTGLAFLFKQPGVLYGAALAGVLSYLTARRALPLRKSLTSLAGLGIGFAVPVGLVGCWVVANGLAEEAYDATIVNALRMAGTPLDPRATLGAWLRVPAVALMFVAAALVVCSRQVRAGLFRQPHLPDLLLWSSAGLLSLLPTLRIGGDLGHYCGPAVWGLTLTCVAVWAALPRLAPRWQGWPGWMNPAAVVVGLQLGPYLAFSVAGAVLIAGQGRLVPDLRQTHEIREVLQERLPAGERLLCLSPAAARLYYMSGRKPANKYLFFWWNTEDKFSRADAWNLLLKGQPGGALLETPLDGGPTDPTAELAECAWQRVTALYEVVPLRSGDHPFYRTRTVILIRRDFDRGRPGP